MELLAQLTGELRQKPAERFFTFAFFQLAFPDYVHLPPIGDKRCLVLSITFLVAVELRRPILGVLLGKRKVAMRATVPIAPVLLEKSQLNI